MNQRTRWRCPVCQRATGPVAAVLGACHQCLSSPAKPLSEQVLAQHAQTREEFGLPGEPPQAESGVACSLCLHRCRLPKGGLGYCGLRTNQGGRLVHLGGTPARGILHCYHDPLPTNCVADWVCPGHGQMGRTNLAVFYGGCTLNCLFCQNWHCRQLSELPRLSASELAAKADERTYCLCFFGGDPTPQMPHALATARHLAERVRICWETNATMAPSLLKAALELSLQSGGCLKIDLKAWDERLHLALTGASNRAILDNFALAASYTSRRSSPPLLVASTLLVPGYVESAEVGQIARFIAGLDPSIPYALLAFAPAFYLGDLPCTPRQQAQECLQAAREAGLHNVRLGNRQLIGAEGL